MTIYDRREMIRCIESARPMDIDIGDYRISDVCDDCYRMRLDSIEEHRRIEEKCHE